MLVAEGKKPNICGDSHTCCFAWLIPSLCHHHLYLFLVITIHSSWACQVVLVVKDLPANAGDVRDAVLISGLEDPPEEGMATHSSILAWRILWTEEPGRLQSMGSQRVGHDWSNLAHTYHMLFC